MAQEARLHTAYEIDLTVFLRQCESSDLEAIAQELSLSTTALAVFFTHRIRLILAGPQCVDTPRAVFSLPVTCKSTASAARIIRYGESIQTLINTTITHSIFIANPGVQVRWSNFG